MSSLLFPPSSWNASSPRRPSSRRMPRAEYTATDQLVRLSSPLISHKATSPSASCAGRQRVLFAKQPHMWAATVKRTRRLRPFSSSPRRRTGKSATPVKALSTAAMDACISVSPKATSKWRNRSETPSSLPMRCALLLHLWRSLEKLSSLHRPGRRGA